MSLKLKGNSKQLTKTKSGINPVELRLAMAEATDCGCGLNCLKGFLSLPNYNSVSGDIDGYTALYIVDGEIVLDTVANAKEAINDFCSLVPTATPTPTPTPTPSSTPA